MILKKLSIALAFMMSLSAVGGLSTSAMALGFSDLLEAGKGHIKDLGDRWNHEDMYIDGDEQATAMFRDDDIGRDVAHWTDGTVSITRTSDGADFIQFHDDFANGLAPDLYVYVADRKVVDEGSFWDANVVEVSKLESGSGAQYYELPVNFEDEDHVEIVIWCKRFGAFMGAASVKSDN